MGTVTYTLDADTAKAVDGFLKVLEAQKKTERQFKETTRAARKQEKSFKAIHTSIIKMAAAAGGIYAIQRALTATVGAGFKFNQTLETSKLGIASLISANYDMVTADGKRLEGLEKINAAQVSAKKLQDDLRIAGLKTTATYEQLVFAFQTAFAPGSAVGLGMDQIQKLTVQITQAAGAIGLPMNQLAEEIRSIFQGTITPRNTRIATALGITNEDIRNWKEAGTLFEELTRKFGTFSDAGVLAEQTWGGLSSNLLDALQQVLGKGFEPLFEFAKVEAREMMDYLITIKDDGVIELNKELVELGRRGSEALIDIYTAGKSVAWVFGQIAGGVDLTYQTIGSWRHLKESYWELDKSMTNIWDLMSGKVDRRTGMPVYQSGTRRPMPKRPATPQLKPGPSPTETKILQRFGRKPDVMPEVEKPKLGADTPEHARFMRQAGMFGMSGDDPLKARYEREKMAIEGHYASLLEQASRFEDAKTLIEELGGKRRRALKRAEADYDKRVMEMRLQHLEYFSGYTAQNFKFLAEHAGKYNKEMFAAYKAFAITQTIIQTYEGAQKSYTALAGISIVGPALGAAAAAAATAAGMMRVRMITQEQPKGYAMGGIVNPTGDSYGVPIRVAERGPEAIVPLPGGRAIPVQLSGAGGGMTVVNVQVAGDVYDRRTMSRLVASVSETVARTVAPGAVKEAFRYNRGGMRDMMR